MRPADRLSPRQRLILRAVVEAYIAGGQPVGSKTLVAAGQVAASSSTVRAELASLEELGVLSHPHTSAGRVPTGEGYRAYVDELVRRPLPPAAPPADLSLAHRELDTALRATAEALSQMTNLLAVVSAPSLESTVVRHVELIRLQPQVLMTEVITSTGGVAKRLSVFDEPVDRGLVEWAAAYLGETVTGLSPGARALRRRLEDPDLGEPERALLQTIAPVFSEAGDGDGAALHVGGRASLLAELQARDIESVREVVAALESRFELLALVRDALDADRLVVRVGDELPTRALHGLSLVAASYGVANRPLGTVSLVGPMRMDYAGAIRSVRAAASALSAFVEDVY
jgi:heat-inducible transcriptional repressor